MFTTETALESLKKYDIDERILSDWESKLGLVVPVDEYGRKQYSPHHINLFKNVRKHLALGRSIEQIREIISLPPTSSSRPSIETPRDTATSLPAKPYASIPQRNHIQKTSGGRGDAAMVDLVNKLVNEKDGLHKKLLETEKLNSHLYNANTMFHRKVKELTQQVSGLKSFIGQVQGKMKESTKDSQNLKLLDDKSRLQKQLIDAEKATQSRDHDVESLNRSLELANEKVKGLEERLENYLIHFSPDVFCGDWIEQGKLVEIVYDNFGINIEAERNRVFRIADKPTRTYGHMAIITTYYEYETNSLWKRTEQLAVAYMSDTRLEGELTVEFILDGVPVSKAIYKTTYTRKK